MLEWLAHEASTAAVQAALGKLLQINGGDHSNGKPPRDRADSDNMSDWEEEDDGKEDLDINMDIEGDLTLGLECKL